LWDIDVVLRRSLLLASMSLCLAAAYLGIVSVADALFGGQRLESAVGAALVIGGIAAPLRSWLQRRVDRLFYGDRAAPDAAVAQLGRRVGDVADRDAVLPEIAGAIAESLRVPYVALDVVDDEGSRLAAEWGRDRFGTERVVLNAQGEVVGHLDVGRREPGTALDPRDLRLLRDLTRHAALAALALRRTHELQQSRQRLVGTREEERRRLRRDLHDGLGPALAATTLQLDEAAELVRTDPNAARTLLQALRIRTQDLITEVRRLVYELRPPALDELGLVGAIRQQAANLSSATVFEVVADPETPALPAAVEVALWRIAGEAMTNVSRHAGARTCQIVVRVTPSHAELEVRDDGRGLNGARPGVGLTSVRERAAELGGTVCTEPSSEGGTVLRAVIPLAQVSG
jgi:signal transduction histidine kinase